MKVVTCDQCGIQHGDERAVAQVCISVNTTMQGCSLHSFLDLCDYDARRIRDDICHLIKRHCPNHEF